MTFLEKTPRGRTKHLKKSIVFKKTLFSRITIFFFVIFLTPARGYKYFGSLSPRHKVWDPKTKNRGRTDKLFKQTNYAILILFKQTLSWFTQTNFAWLNL